MTQLAKENKANVDPGSWSAMLGLALIAVVGWSFWPTLTGLAHTWRTNPSYSHGYLVPLFAAYLLWVRRPLLTGPLASGAKLGFTLLLITALGRVTGAIFIFPWVDALSLLPCLAAIVVLIGGRSALRWSWPAIGFLFFMIPLPYRIESLVGGPLQQVATLGSAFLLQTFGLPAVTEGNTILLNDVKLEIVEACSGLRMLVTFFAFSSGVAILVRKPWLERLCIVLSAIPIALLTNILRITATGIMYQVDAEFAKKFFHDLAGWVMMPICLGFLGIELWILNRLILEARSNRPALLLK